MSTFFLAVILGFIVGYLIARVKIHHAGFRAGYETGLMHAKYVFFLFEEEHGPTATFFKGEKTITTHADYPPC